MIVIQTPKKEDISGIQDVFYKTWLATYPNEEIGITKEDIIERFKNSFSEEGLKRRTNYFLNIPENELFLIAKEGPNVVGVCKFVKREKFNQLQAIYVLPKYQGKGIGFMFWEKAQEFIGDSKDIIVQVAAYNKQAISFYKKLGFIDTGKRFTDEKLKMPISGVVMPEMEMIIKNVKDN